MLITALFVQFWLFPNINQYKNDIAQALSKGLKQPVTISSIRANWKNLQPSAVLDNVIILDAENRPALSLKQSEIVLSWLSFLALEPRFADITIYSPHLEVRRSLDGAIWVAGIQVNNAEKSDPSAANWLLRQSAIHISNASLSWTDEIRNAPALQLEDVNIALTSPPWKKLLKNHLLTMSAQPTVGTKKPITISANVYGNDVSQLHTWRGKLSLAIQNTDLTAFKPWFDYPIAIERGFGSLVGQLHFAHNEITNFDSDLKIKNTLVRLPTHDVREASALHSGATNTEDLTNPSQWIAMDALSTLLNWSSDARQSDFLQTEHDESTQAFAFNRSNFHLNIKHLNLTLKNREALREANASILVKDKALQSFETDVQFADLEALTTQLSLIPLAEKLNADLTQAAPKGELRYLSALWKRGQNQAPHYKFSTEFKALGIRPTPLTKVGFAGLDGKVNLDETNGRLNLASTNASLDLKDTLRWPLLQNKLTGMISWRVTQALNKANPQNNQPIIDISTQGLSVQNPHLMGKVNASYQINASDGDYIDISGQFEKAQAKYALFYYPTSLSAATLNWLDTSILGGEVNDIKVIIKGRVNDFPFVDKNQQIDSRLGIFKVTGNLSNGLLEYGSDWPKIEQLNTSLLFEGTRMELNTTAGRIFGNEIVKSRVTIAQLDADYPMLVVDSEAKGPVSEGVKFVNKSPVAEITQGFTQDLITTGQGKLNLKLNIPLENIDVATFKGRYEIKNGSMQSASMPMINSLNGTLEFTEKELTANNVKAQVFGAPAAFSIATNADKSVRITAKGILNETSINTFLQNASTFITGASQWVANILIKTKS